MNYLLWILCQIGANLIPGLHCVSPGLLRLANGIGEFILKISEVARVKGSVTRDLNLH